MSAVISDVQYIDISELKPSNFRKKPTPSIYKNSSHENVAYQIVRLQAIKGNRWRRVTWAEYQKYRGKVTASWERAFFDRVVDYTVSPKKCKEFSTNW